MANVVIFGTGRGDMMVLSPGRVLSAGRCAADAVTEAVDLENGTRGSSMKLHVLAIAILAVGLGLVPPTGLALPLVSYGRSNQIVTLASVGMLIAIARATDPNVGGLWPRWWRRGESRA